MLNSFQNFSTNGFPIEILSIISIISLVLAILVINSKNPIVSVLFLIGLFLSIASYLFCLGMHFIGMAYLLVYVGAVSILFLFILMLINIRISELSNNTNNTLSLGFLISVFLSIVLFEVLPNTMISFNNILQLIESLNINTIFNVTSVSWDKNLAEVSHITSIGNILYTVYSILIILTAIILLLAMVGTIAITIKQKTNNAIDQFNLTSSLSWSIISLYIIEFTLNIIYICIAYIFYLENDYNLMDIYLDSLHSLAETGEIIITIEVDITEEINDGSPTGTITTITGGNSSIEQNGQGITIVTEIDVTE